MSSIPQPPPPPPEPPPPQPDQPPPRDPFFIDTRKLPPLAAGKSARVDKPGKTPKFLLLVATICWPIASVLYGGWEYRRALKWGEDRAAIAAMHASWDVFWVYVTSAVICLAWWFYVKD